MNRGGPRSTFGASFSSLETWPDVARVGPRLGPVDRVGVLGPLQEDDTGGRFGENRVRPPGLAPRTRTGPPVASLFRLVERGARPGHPMRPFDMVVAAQPTQVGPAPRVTITSRRPFSRVTPTKNVAPMPYILDMFYRARPVAVGPPVRRVVVGAVTADVRPF